MHRARVYKAPPPYRGGWPWTAEALGSMTFHPTWEDAMECAHTLVRLYNPGVPSPGGRGREVLGADR